MNMFHLFFFGEPEGTGLSFRRPPCVGQRVGPQHAHGRATADMVTRETINLLVVNLANCPSGHDGVQRLSVKQGPPEVTQGAGRWCEWVATSGRCIFARGTLGLGSNLHLDAKVACDRAGQHHIPRRMNWERLARGQQDFGTCSFCGWASIRFGTGLWACLDCRRGL